MLVRIFCWLLVVFFAFSAVSALVALFTMPASAPIPGGRFFIAPFVIAYVGGMWLALSRARAERKKLKALSSQ